MSPALQADSLPSEPQGKPKMVKGLSQGSAVSWSPRLVYFPRPVTFQKRSGRATHSATSSGALGAVTAVGVLQPSSLRGSHWKGDKEAISK